MSVLCYGHVKRHHREKSFDGWVYSSKKIIALQIVASTPKSFAVATCIFLLLSTLILRLRSSYIGLFYWNSSVLNFFNFFSQLFSLYFFFTRCFVHEFNIYLHRIPKSSFDYFTPIKISYLHRTRLSLLRRRNFSLHNQKSSWLFEFSN